MNKIFFLLLCPLLLVAKVHYAKVEPYDSVVLKSSVSGQVLDVALDAEGTIVDVSQVIHIDDRLDRVNLEDTKIGIDLLQEMLRLNKEIAKGLKGTVTRQESYYKRISRLSTASKTQKDNAYNAFSSAKTQYLSTKEKIISLQKQILDMQYKIAQLEDSVTKKSIVLEHKYLYKLMVRAGDFVVPGTPLAKVEDMSRAKLVLFLDKDELLDINAKSLYLNGSKTTYKIDKIWKMADEKFISSYRAEIYITAPQGMFSDLMKVEIK
jgi:multidrug resistance efflux pump